MSLVMDTAAIADPELARRGCPIDHALQAVGTRVSFLLLREAFYGTTRFDAFVERVGVTEAVVAAHLKSLTAAGLFERVPYREPGQRTRFEYRLTDAGSDLLPVLLALRQWTLRHAPGQTTPFDIIETESGLPVEVRICAGDGPALTGEDITLRASPLR